MEAQAEDKPALPKAVIEIRKVDRSRLLNVSPDVQRKQDLKNKLIQHHRDRMFRANTFLESQMIEAIGNPMRDFRNDPQGKNKEVIENAVVGLLDAGISDKAPPATTPKKEEPEQAILHERNEVTVPVIANNEANGLPKLNVLFEE